MPTTSISFGSVKPVGASPPSRAERLPPRRGLGPPPGRRPAPRGGVAPYDSDRHSGSPTLAATSSAACALPRPRPIARADQGPSGHFQPRHGTALAAVSDAVRLVPMHYLDEGDLARRRSALTSKIDALRDREIASVARYQRLFREFISNWMGDPTESASLRAELMAAAVVSATIMCSGVGSGRSRPTRSQRRTRRCARCLPSSRPAPCRKATREGPPWSSSGPGGTSSRSSPTWDGSSRTETGGDACPGMWSCRPNHAVLKARARSRRAR